MRAPRALAVALLLLPVAGCFSDAAEVAPTDAASGSTVTIDEDRPEPTFNDIPEADLGFVALPDLNATLDAAPRLVEGEWWRIHLVSPLSGDDVEFVRVVARVEEDLYVMGMPHEGWYKEAMVYHSPAFGDVNKDLSHRAHDIPFVPLRFPLADGATWETKFETEQVLVATAKLESPTEARVTFRTPDAAADAPPVVEIVYDAAVHEVVFFRNAYMTWEVVEHGYGFEGWITVPRGEDLVFFDAQCAGGVGLSGASIGPMAPVRTLPVEGGFNRVSFILMAGNILGVPGPTPGVYKVKATSPSGEVYELDATGETGLATGFFEGKDPDGEWTIEHVAAGPGCTFIEGIAYHQYDIHLPTGNIRSDHSHDVVR